MQNATSEEIKKLVRTTDLIRVTFGIAHPYDMPQHWVVKERNFRAIPCRPILVLPRKNVAPLCNLLRGRGYRLHGATASAEYEPDHPLRKQRVTFFWSKGTSIRISLERTPDAIERMSELCHKYLYTIEIYADQNNTVGFYCKPTTH